MAFAALLIGLVALYFGLVAYMRKPQQVMAPVDSASRYENVPALVGHQQCVQCSRRVPIYHGEPEGPRHCHFCKARRK